MRKSYLIAALICGAFIVAGLNLAGCTAEQLSKADKFAAATTQATTNPVVVVGTVVNPYVAAASYFASLAAAGWIAYRQGRKQNAGAGQ
jgi:Na+/phosphate symporter